MLVRAFIPVNIQAVITGSSFSLNLYQYFPLENQNLYQYFLSKFEYEQTSSSLQLLGIENVSTFANVFPILASTFYMILYSISVYFLRRLFLKYRESKRWSWLAKTLFWITDKIWRMMVLAYFIRSALEMSQFILICSINEINEFNTANSFRIISLMFSFIMIFLFLIMIGFILYITLSPYRLNENDHNKLEEFFRGIKQNKKHKLYTTILLLRRFIFILFIIVLTMISSRFLIGVMIVVQIFYFICLLYLRPYEQIKENLIEILNEFYFSYLTVTLAFINSEDEWNETKSNVCMWIFVSNTYVILLIDLGKEVFNSIVFFAKLSIIWIWRKWNGNEVNF